MAQAQNKTQPTELSVQDFIADIVDEQRRTDSRTLDVLMSRVAGEPGKMWGSNIVGYGQYHYRYESGREGDYLAIGFSPRKAYLTIYALDGLEKHQELLATLGRYKTGKSCLYIDRLTDVDLTVLEQILLQSYDATMKRSAQG